MRDFKSVKAEGDMASAKERLLEMSETLKSFLTLLPTRGNVVDQTVRMILEKTLRYIGVLIRQIRKDEPQRGAGESKNSAGSSSSSSWLSMDLLDEDEQNWSDEKASEEAVEEDMALTKKLLDLLQSKIKRSLALLPAQGNEIDKKYRRALAESLALVELQVQVVEVLKRSSSSSSSASDSSRKRPRDLPSDY